MKCKSCGKHARTIDSMCIWCYLNSNLPTEVHNRYWLFMESNKKRGLDRSNLDLKLRLAITFTNPKISLDKKSIVLEVDGKEVSIPVTIEKLDELAEKSGVLVGKWLIYRDGAEIDEVWKTIAESTFRGELGNSAKVSTAMPKQKRHVICVYTKNYLDLEDVKRARGKLRELGFSERLCYKPDIYTYLGIYSGTTTLSPCRYHE